MLTSLLLMPMLLLLMRLFADYVFRLHYAFSPLMRLRAASGADDASDDAFVYAMPFRCYDTLISLSMPMPRYLLR